jgi:energy-coupling factor transport system ATP-binding protein
MGATGVGKSTLCRCLNGLIPSFIKGELTGNISLFGEAIDSRHVYKTARRIGLVFQDFEAQLFSTDVQLEVAFGLENFAVDRQEMPQRVTSALKRVGLSGFEDRDPSTLSGGEKQRLAIASVLVSRPTVLVMDEPTTDLDPIGKRDIFDLACELRQEIDGIILVEHETEHVLTADRLVIMSEGTILREGPPADLLSDPHFLEKYGIRPLQTAVLLERLRVPAQSLVVSDAVESIRTAGWQASLDAATKLTDSDQEISRDTPVIEVQELVHRYQDGRAAVDGVSLRVDRGEFVAVVGQNGCGKTTLVKHFNGLHHPTEGEVSILEKPSADWTLSELGRKVGYVFQNPDHQIFANSIREEIAFGPANFGLSPAEVSHKVEEAMEVVGLSNRGDDDPFSLTKGERQQLAVASVLATDPEILILDEPTTGLDYQGQRTILDLIEGLNTSGRTIIMITHSMWVVAEYASRCIMMSGGKVIADSPVRECFQNGELLESIMLEAPEAVRLGQAFGLSVRSIDELVNCLEKAE